MIVAIIVCRFELRNICMSEKFVFWQFRVIMKLMILIMTRRLGLTAVADQDKICKIKTYSVSF